MTTQFEKRGQSLRSTFEQWKACVDQILELNHGLSSDDLPDCCYLDWYNEHVSPATAARRAIRNAE